MLFHRCQFSDLIGCVANRIEAGSEPGARQCDDAISFIKMIAGSATAWQLAARPTFRAEPAFAAVPASPDLEWLRACADYLARRDV